MSKEAFVAYVAGFTDGEGYLGWHRGSGYRIQISQGTREALDAIAKRLGYGRVISGERPKRGKPMYILVIGSAEECAKFLCYVGPYLQVKRAVADKLFRRILYKQAQYRAIRLRNRLIGTAMLRGVSRHVLKAKFAVSDTTCYTAKKEVQEDAKERRI